jgi:FHS family L-fucose permease-like MFS transporter
MVDKSLALRRSSSMIGIDPIAMVLVTTLFFVWGFISALNDILIPYFKAIFSLNYFQSTLVQLAFFVSYALFALPSGSLVGWLGYKRTMVLGLMVMALGAAFFLPAAAKPSYLLFLSALMVTAAGITVLQVAGNPYLTRSGAMLTASSRLTLAQAFNSLGTMTAPWIGAWLILRKIGKTVESSAPITQVGLQHLRVLQASAVKLPYGAIAVSLMALACLVASYKFPHLESTRDLQPHWRFMAVNLILSHRQLWMGAVAIFLYVGAEASIASFLVNYFNLPEIGNLSLAAGAALVPFYGGGMMVGRFAGAAVMRSVPPSRLLGVCGVMAALLTMLSTMTFGYFAMCTILMVGLFNSIMFPTIFALGLADLGPLSAQGSGLLVFAIVGGGIVPAIEGVLADRIGVHHAFLLPFLCYLFVAYYGFSGFRAVPYQSPSKL